MFSILFGLYQSSIIDFKLWLVRYFYFLYYQPLPLKQLMTRLSVVGSYLFRKFVRHVIDPYCMAYSHCCCTGWFWWPLFFEVYDISKPGAFFGVMVTAMGASTSIPLAKIPFMSGCMLLGIGFSILFALVLHFTEKEISVPLAKRSLRERIYQHPEAPLDSIYYSFVLFLLYISAKVYIYKIRIG